MQVFPAQGMPHIALSGAGLQSLDDFRQAAPGMPLMFDQPDPGDASKGHLRFDPGDRHPITIFCNGARG